MEIRFCELCQESIPDADFESAKAVSADGRSICATCIARRALAGGGVGRGWLTMLVALVALGGVTWLVASQGRQAGVSPAVATAIKEQGAQTLADSDARLTATAAKLQTRLAGVAELSGALEGLSSDLKALAERTAAERAELQSRIDQIDGRIVGLERQVGEVHAWLRELQRRAAEPPAPAPESSPTPTPTNTPEPAPAPAPAPERVPVPPPAPATDAATLQHWIDLLKDPNAGIAFSATLELGRLKDLRAVPALMTTLKTYRDFYVRLGAADALRELKACDAVVALVEALDDKDDLVRTASNQALMFITGHQEPFAATLPKTELRRVQKAWEKWWKENEASVRTRLSQPKQG